MCRAAFAAGRPERKGIMGKEFRHGFQNYVRKEVPANNRKGRRVIYVYQGEMRHFAMSAGEFRAMKVRFFVLALAWAAVHVGTLCLPVPSNATNLVTIPALLGLFAVGYAVYGVLSLLACRQDAPAWEYDSINRAMQIGAAGAMALMAVTLAFNVGYQLMEVQAFVPLELLAMAGCVGSILLAYTVFRGWRKLTVTAYHTNEKSTPA